MVDVAVDLGAVTRLVVGGAREVRLVGVAAVVFGHFLENDAFAEAVPAFEEEEVDCGSVADERRGCKGGSQLHL